jgi:hypothetical protein
MIDHKYRWYVSYSFVNEIHHGFGCITFTNHFKTHIPTRIYQDMKKQIQETIDKYGPGNKAIIMSIQRI